MVISEEKKHYLIKATEELDKIEKKYLIWLEECNLELKEKTLSKLERQNFKIYHRVPEIREATPQFDHGEPIAVQK